MKLRNLCKRTIAIALTLCTLLSLLPTSVLAANAAAAAAEKEAIRQTLLESVSAEEYPQGLFDFLTPRMETSEDVGEAEFAIVRRGNTDEAASVTFKIIDMTAEYGKDYVIKVPGLLFDKELEGNPNSQPLYSEGVYRIGDDTESVDSENYDADETVPETDTEQDSADENEESTEYYELNKVEDGTDLQSARTALTGTASTNTTWRDADEAEIAVLTEAYGDLYDELEGIEYVLNFAPGEYIKTLKFVTLNDKISEDEEQVLFVLCHPENCVVSENPTGFMNIVDDEEPEALTFDFTTDIVTVDEGSFTAELTIERLTGLYRYGTVEVSSAEVSAVESVHYDGFAAEITFVPGQQYQKIEIPIKSHPSLEDVEFLVYIGDYEECASVVISSGAAMGETTSESDNKNDSTGYSLRSASNDTMLLGTNDDLWVRKDTVTPTVKSSNGSYDTYWGDSSYWYIPISKKNQHSSMTLELDLSMVGKIEVTSQEFYEGTWYDDTYWFFGTRGKKGYYHDMWNYISIDGSQKVSHYHKYNTTDTITLSDSDRKAGTITYGTYVSGECKEAMGLYKKDVVLHYLPVEIQIGMWDDDAMIQPKIYTSPTNSTNNGNAFLAGKLKFAGESASTTSKFFYNEDVVKLEETSRTEADNTYLWGIKFEAKAGSTNEFFYYEGTSFSIKDLYTGKLKDVNGKTIGSTAKLSDTINGETFPCYRIYPVYKQKTAYTTIKIDETKSQFATGTFKNEETIKTGILDKIQINIAGKGDWAVSGFNLACGNSGASKITTAQQERALYKQTATDGNNTYKTWSPIYRADSDWATSLVNAGASIPGSYLFQPTKNHNSLEALYQKPEITVAVNPRAENTDAQSKGYVAYADENGNGQVAKYTETDSDGLLRGDEINISPYRAGDTYQLIGGFEDATETGYKFQWQDFTGDIDRDGKLSYEEIKALGDGYDLINKGVYAGDIFNYVPQIMGSPVLYYNIVPKAQNDTGVLNTLSGNVLIRSSSVIDNSKLKPTYTYIPVANATVTAGGETVVTDAEGKWEIKSASFAVGETYTVILTYGGRSYTGEVTVNRWATDFLIDEYNTFNVKNFNAYRVSDDSEYENVEDWNLHGLSNSAISNEDKRHLYTFEIEELLPTTATVGRVEVNRYSADGVLKKTYIAVYNEENGVYEVKDPDLLENYTPGEGAPDEYIYSFNPATETIVAGDYLTVRVYDQYDIGYIEHNIGFTYKPKLSVINIVNSFQSPVNKVIDFIGDVDMTFDLGLTAKMDDLDSKVSDAVENKLTVTTDDDTRTISFGWNKDFKKSYDSSKAKGNKKDATEGENKNPENSEAPKSAAEIIFEEAKKLEDASDQPGEDKDKKDAAADTAKQAVDKDSKDNEKTSKVTANMSVNLSVALELVMGYDKTENRYYFQNFVVTGVVKGSAETKYEYTTPIGIVIFVKGSLSGDITALLAIEPYYQNPAEPEYLYMDEAGTIDLTNIGNADVDRQLSVYGKLMVRPKVTLSVGASAVSDKIASVSLNGAADFDMVFTTAGEGSGNVTLTADLLLEVLGGMVKKRWLIAQKSYNMFSYDSRSMARLMSVNEDYRYDVITEEDTDQKLYLENRSGWNEWGDVSLFTTGTDSYNEVILQTGAYPYAYPQIFMLYEGDEYDYTGRTSEQILLFLDQDSEKVCLMYSIYQDSGDGRGYTWTQPSPVDADTAGDDTPRVEDLGDKLFITWSSQSRIDSDNPVDKLNSRDIKAVFFDKSTKSFSDVQYITQTTDADKTADDYASASYYKATDGTELLMVTYIKTQYEQTGEDLVVGDLLDAYSTIAYRFYDFETGAWVDTYSGTNAQTLRSTLSDEQIEQFEANWYGQGFVDLSRYVTVNDEDLLIPENEQYAGLWSTAPDEADISIAILDNDPKVVEHETINCGKYAVSAYLVDLDKNISTVDDRDIFLQFYDYEEDVFYPAMRLTNDAHNQTYLEFMEAPDGVTLYYISDGDIVQQNISDIVNYLIEADVDGEKVLLQNKCYGYYSGETVILDSDENNPYTEFIVNTDGYNVYLTWTESSISVAEGIDINSSEATLPENYYAERQMYMAMQTFTSSEYQHKDENGNALTYPSTDSNGNPIDWNTTPDINGEVGKVKAGDPIVRTVYASRWTEPVQMTDEQGANFSDIDCVMIGGGILRCVYLKGFSEIMEVGGEQMSAENTDNRALISADFDFNVERYSISIDNVDEVEAGAEGMPIHITVKNESLLTMTDILVPLNMFQGEEQSFVGNATIDELVGGGSATITIEWDVPETLDNVSLTALVYHGGMEFESVTENFQYDGLIEITDVSYELVDRNTAEFTVLVQNTGSENAVNERVYVNCGGTVSKSEAFDLVSGSTAMITLTADIPEDAFEESRTETEITESALVKIYTTGSIVNHAVVRSANVELEELLDSITGLVDLDGNTYSTTIQMDIGDMMMLEAADGNDAINRAHLSVESENESVVSIVNGVLTGEATGNTKLNIELYPNADTYLADDNGTMREINNYLTLPSCLIRNMEVNVLVGEGGDDTTDHYTVTFDANGGTGTMADITGVSGEYTLPANGFTAPDGKQFKAWSVDGNEKAVGDKITVTADTTVTAIWEPIPAGHTCNIKPVPKVKPTCTEDGKDAYYVCQGCGKFYEDALGAKEITDLAAWGNLTKLDHTESDWKSDKDNHWKECTVIDCGVIIENSKAAHKDSNSDGKCDTCEYNVGALNTPDSPETGDNSHMQLWIALLFISGGAVITLTVVDRKRRTTSKR